MTLHPDRTRLSRGADLAVDRPRDDLESVLENDRRRAVLRHLLGNGDPVSLGTLAGRVAAAEDDATAVTTVLERRQRVHVALRRTHLPLLESHGLVSYDRDRGIVSHGDEFDDARADLEAALLD